MTVCKIYSNARFHLQSVEEFIDTYEKGTFETETRKTKNEKREKKIYKNNIVL